MALQSKFSLRLAQAEDCDALFNLIKALAEYEKLPNAVSGNVNLLRQHLFAEPQYIEAIVAESLSDIVGFALFFHNYSTFLTKPGIYLEDLFVLPDYRRQGIGKALLIKLAQIALKRDCGRLEWSVLDWNEPAQKFYRAMGASILDDWRICRVTGEKLTKLADNHLSVNS
ncbi:GNAT family N-acetyltransferase [Mastigocoleus testarum]|uniref:GNAT family acetyltransferase n=1 Tax=Mastigocoleus testarum BC008 TaxID=371196 RepID=A0A0V7ZQT0_9CYAN|nr:GNAT family N-acetyltransferase [Mastigocoleus testarum]KST66997.1 GNAT family acetyltransferase [Mastigocoleus testarum BC008]KST67114.1 GNAT family acetyltransferase [Mastigocoleus testarum BC008]